MGYLCLFIHVLFEKNMFYLYFSLFNKNIHEVKNIVIRIVLCHTYRDTYRIVKMCIVTSLSVSGHFNLCPWSTARRTKGSIGWVTRRLGPSPIIGPNRPGPIGDGPNRLVPIRYQAYTSMGLGQSVRWQKRQSVCHMSQCVCCRSQTQRVREGQGGCFNKHDGRATGRRAILQWTNNIGGWSVTRSDSPSCWLKQAPGPQLRTVWDYDPDMYRHTH